MDTVSESTLAGPKPLLSKTLLLGAGGFGVKGVTERASHIKPGEPIRVLGFDVQSQPRIEVVDEHGSRPFQLLDNISFVRIGLAMDLHHTAAVLKKNPNLRPLLARLFSLLDGRLQVQSLETGTEAQRILGFVALEWSRIDVERAIERVLRDLNDLRLEDGTGVVFGNAPINVIMVNSACGGVGSSIALPLAGITKGVMNRLGIPVHRSLFTQFNLLPDAFPASRIREANAFATLRDIQLSQQKGVVLWRS